MKTLEFLKEYPMLIASNMGEDVFATIMVMCPGLSTPKLGKILNRAVSYLEKDEIYCEIGTYCGYTLISSAYHNQEICLGIDNHMLCGLKTEKTEQEKVKNRLFFNLNLMGSRNIRFISSDYKEIALQEKVGVFYIDGEHTREEAYRNLKWGHEFLADKALIFVDDISSCGVGDGIKDWVKDHEEEYNEVFRMNVFYDKDKAEGTQWNPVFWNGLSIIEFNRKK